MGERKSFHTACSSKPEAGKRGAGQSADWGLVQRWGATEIREGNALVRIGLTRGRTDREG